MDDTDDNHRYSYEVARLAHEGRQLLLAPSVFLCEVTYTLLRRGRAGRWGHALIEERAELIDVFRVRLIESTASVPAMARFALRHNVQGFDAFYLALALSAGAQLATLDGGLRSAARRAGVELFTPA
ncbi:type II toxin-antitoxin system VapC family toxin [Rubrivivax rivuli]|uniref:type II toxin-antitoxin system VapC family toxin n=1 Tax=Rubrivivax rivuli TaxID=1862385 RepID=UPI0013E36661|nr:type II toxin-antitoxin system VapC family toxin [Rubrivivax rivuli]